jgi:hypothetical protein
MKRMLAKTAIINFESFMVSSSPVDYRHKLVKDGPPYIDSPRSLAELHNHPPTQVKIRSRWVR